MGHGKGASTSDTPKANHPIGPAIHSDVLLSITPKPTLTTSNPVEGLDNTQNTPSSCFHSSPHALSHQASEPSEVRTMPSSLLTTTHSSPDLTSESLEIPMVEVLEVPCKSPSPPPLRLPLSHHPLIPSNPSHTSLFQALSLKTSNSRPRKPPNLGPRYGERRDHSPNNDCPQDGRHCNVTVFRTKYRSHSLRRHNLVDRTDQVENRTRLEHHPRSSNLLILDGIPEVHRAGSSLDP
ncbi:unnamed protein product [Camellia sinensis]